MIFIYFLPCIWSKYNLLFAMSIVRFARCFQKALAGNVSLVQSVDARARMPALRGGFLGFILSAEPSAGVLELITQTFTTLGFSVKCGHSKYSCATGQTMPQDVEADSVVDIGSVACPDIKQCRH